MCRLYNKKNNPKERIIPPQDNNTSPLDELQSEQSYSDNSGSLDSFEYSDGDYGGKIDSDFMFLGDIEHEPSTITKDNRDQCDNVLTERLIQNEELDYGNNWLDGLSLADLHHCLEAMPTSYDISWDANDSNQQNFFL